MTKKIAFIVGQKVKNGGIVCLSGELGSGKTIFTQGIASALKINQFSIKSPTYTYIRYHQKYGRNFYHIDLYRLEVVDELIWEEINELLQQLNNILVIEWADRIVNRLPKSRIEVYMEYLDEGERKITIKQIS